jgi:sigma-B regulation protein RsbU (phosphoserine phosphatase)
MLKSECNLVLGAIEGMPFKNESLQLEKGDTLVTYTDGVTEAENIDHQQFGESRLEETLAGLKGATSEAIVTAVNAKVKEFAGEAPQSDDITLLVIRRQ